MVEDGLLQPGARIIEITRGALASLRKRIAERTGGSQTTQPVSVGMPTDEHLERHVLNARADGMFNSICSWSATSALRTIACA